MLVVLPFGHRFILSKGQLFFRSYIFEEVRKFDGLLLSSAAAPLSSILPLLELF